MEPTARRQGRWRPLLLPAAVALAAVAACLVWLAPLDAAFAAGFAILAVIAAATDLDRFEIPDWTSAGILALGLVHVGFGVGIAGEPDGLAAGPPWLDLVDALARAAVAAGSLYAVRLIYRATRGIEGLGLGDVKLAGALGPWLAWEDLPTALTVAVSATLVAILVRSAVTRTPVEGAAAVPFGAFLAPAAFAVFFARAAGLALPAFG